MAKWQKYAGPTYVMYNIYLGQIYTVCPPSSTKTLQSMQAPPVECLERKCLLDRLSGETLGPRIMLTPSASSLERALFPILLLFTREAGAREM